MIEIVRILVTAGDSKNARAKNAGERMGDQQGITRIGNDGGEFVRQSLPALGLPQKHHAGVRGDASAVECGGDLLAANGWKREREGGIFGHGARGGDGMA